MGDVEGEGAVGDALVDGGVLTVGVGPRHSWRRFPWASLARLLAPLVSLMSLVLYRVVSPWRLSLTLWVVFAEVALSVAVSVMPVVRSLRALLWFTASLMLLMLLVVGVGLCVGGQWPVFGVGRWLISVALSGRVWSRWCGLLVMLLVRVVQAMPRVVSWLRVVLVAPVVWVPLVTATRRLRPDTNTPWATTERGAHIYAYQPTMPCRLPQPGQPHHDHLRGCLRHCKPHPGGRGGGFRVGGGHDKPTAPTPPHGGYHLRGLLSRRTEDAGHRRGRHQ